MSGETEQQVSGWTVDTLHSHMAELLNEMDRRYEQRFIDSEKAVSAALSAAEKAVSKAEMASEKRFEGVNEFRAALQDSQGRNVSRSEYDSAHKALVEKIDSIAARTDRMEANAIGENTATDRANLASNRIVGALIAGCAAIIGAIALAASLVR